MRKLIAKLRSHADLAFSLFVVCFALLLVRVSRASLSLLFVLGLGDAIWDFLNWCWSVWQRIYDFFKSARDVAADMYANACKVLRDWWTHLNWTFDWRWDIIRDFFDLRYANAKRVLDEWWEKVKRFFVDLWTTADFLLVKIFERLNYLGETVWSRIDKVAHDYWGTLVDYIGSLYIRVDRLCRDLWDKLMQYGYVIYDKLYDIGYWWHDKIKSLVDTRWPNVDDFFTNLIDRAKTLLRDKWDIVQKWLAGEIGDVIGLVTAKWPVLGWFFTGGWEIWGTIFVDPYKLVYLLMGWIQLKRNILKENLMWFGEHLLRFLVEGVW